MLAALLLSAQLIVSANTTVLIGGDAYGVIFAPDVQAVVPTANGGIQFKAVAATSRCPIAMNNFSSAQTGAIYISTSLTPLQQAKALIHEVTHIAQVCDKRDLPVDERIAQDIADLLNSSEGHFVLKELAP